MTDRDALQNAIAALDAQRAVLGDAMVEAALAPLRRQLATPPEQPGEQRKQVTVLFAALDAFEQLVDSLEPEEAHAVQDTYLARMSDAMARYGGRLVDTVGAEVMGVFGATAAQESDPENAVHAALAMQKAWLGLHEEWRRTLSAAHTVGLALRVGVNTGMVVVGYLGGQRAQDFTVVGDAVNLASRLQHAAPPGGILIGHDTFRLVRGVFKLHVLAPLPVRGKVEPVQAYRVEGSRPRAFRVATRGVEGVETHMIGRAVELRRLQDAYHAMQATRSWHSVLVVGDAGLGKSRLLYEFDIWIDLQPETKWYFQARAGEERVQRPYALLRDLFAFRFEILDSDRTAVAREKLERGFVYFMGEGGQAAAHFAGQLLGLDFSDSPHLQGVLDDARQLYDRALRALEEFFRAVSRVDPAVVYLEDLQWADDASLDLFEVLAAQAPDIPMLLIGLARPGFFARRASWAAATRERGQATGAASNVLGETERVDLHPLSADESEQLVRDILRLAGTVPDVLCAHIVTSAEGSPFYVEELIKMLVDDGVIVPGAEGAAWRVVPGRVAGLHVPPSLMGVLQARLDGLGLHERQTLQRASVVGRVFWEGAVTFLARAATRADAVAGGDADATRAALDVLWRRELIFLRAGSAFAGDREYVFKHALLRDVTYESMLKRVRRSYHAQVALWVSERSGERAGEVAGLVAEHYELARDPVSAAEWYGRAGHQAREAYAPEAAIGYYQKALGLLGDDRNAERETGAAATPAGAPAPVSDGSPAEVHERISLLSGLAGVLFRQAHYSEASVTYRTLRAAGEAAGDLRAQAHAWIGLASVQRSQGDNRAALESAGRAETLARAMGEPVEALRALIGRGWALYRLGDAAAALECGGEAQSLAQSLGEEPAVQRELANSLNLLGVVQVMQGHYVAAHTHFERALALHRQMGNRRMVGVMLANLGAIADVCGDYSASVTLNQEVLSIAREIGDRAGEMEAFNNLAASRVRLGHFSEAEQDARDALGLALKGGASVLSDIYANLAEACLGLGQHAEALAAAKRALALAQEIDEPESLGGAWRALGRVSTGAPDTTGGYVPAACFAESARIFAAIGYDVERAETLRAWSRFELGRGAQAEGERLWQEAREIFVRLGLELEVARMVTPGKYPEQ